MGANESDDDVSNSNRPEIKEFSNGQRYLVESPPSLSYIVDLASSEEKNLIFARLKSMARQTMNFRSMPKARVIVLKDMEKGGKIIGWQGFDFESVPNYPEKFSLHLDTEYRSFLLGLALEQAMAMFLQSKGVEKVFARMQSSSNKSLMDWRLKAGVFSPQESDQLDSSWKDKCKECELFGQRCPTQAYFTFNIPAALELGFKRIGFVQFTGFPVKLKISPNKIRGSGQNQKKYRLDWAG